MPQRGYASGILEKGGSFESGWTQGGTERRREGKQEMLSERLNEAADALSSNNKALTFIGKTIDGKCPFCQKKQSWMRMSYSRWAGFIGVLALIAAIGAIGTRTFDGSRAQLESMKTVMPLVIVCLILSIVGLIIHSVVMLVRTVHIIRQNPVYLARTVNELVAKIADHPEYLDHLNNGDSRKYDMRPT